MIREKKEALKDQLVKKVKLKEFRKNLDPKCKTLEPWSSESSTFNLLPFRTDSVFTLPSIQF